MADSITKHVRSSESYSRTVLAELNRSLRLATEQDQALCIPLLLDLMTEARELQEHITRLREACEACNPVP